MSESKSKPEEPKDHQRFSQEQYNMLKRCSDNEDITEWNEWRKKHSGKDVELKDADFTVFYLKQALLLNAHIEGAKLRVANLTDANLGNAHLEGADLCDTNLEGANLNNAHLQGAQFRLAVVSGSTSLCYCHVDRQTDFREVAFGNTRIDPGTKQLLEYNIRRMNWEEWYKKHSLLKWLVKPFWWISDYGLRIWRIIVTFFGLAFIFALAYWLWPSCVMVNSEVGDIQGLWHALYFSVVTMTTLGFGDIAANPNSWVGQTLLMIQVILGYVLLGALVTRFAVLFTAGGPAGEFAMRKRNKSCPKPKIGWDELARDKTILQTGDVIHVQNRGVLSKLVRFFSRAWTEEPSWASHSAMVLRVGEEIEIIEALWKTVIRPITAYKGKKSKLLVCRKPGGIGEEQKQKMIEKAEYYKGKTYGYLKIAYHILDRFLNNRYVFRRLIKDNEYPICSWLVAYVYDRVLKYHFGAPPNAAQPDDLLDHSLDYDWEFIWADSSKSVADFCRTYKLFSQKS